MTRQPRTRWTTATRAILMLVAIVGAIAWGGWTSHRLSHDAREHATALAHAIHQASDTFARRVDR